MVNNFVPTKDMNFKFWDFSTEIIFLNIFIRNKINLRVIFEKSCSISPFPAFFCSFRKTQKYERQNFK